MERQCGGKVSDFIGNNNLRPELKPATLGSKVHRANYCTTVSPLSNYFNMALIFSCFDTFHINYLIIFLTVHTCTFQFIFIYLFILLTLFILTNKINIYSIKREKTCLSYTFQCTVDIIGE